jgi:predicted RNase H-like HicB family nuclease
MKTVNIASYPALQGCYSQGDSVDEALQNLKDAILLQIEARHAFGELTLIERLIEDFEIVVKN